MKKLSFLLVIFICSIAFSEKVKECYNPEVLYIKCKKCTDWRERYNFVNSAVSPGKFNQFGTAEILISLSSFNFKKAGIPKPENSDAYRLVMYYQYPNDTRHFYKYATGMVDSCGNFLIPPKFTLIEHLRGKAGFAYVDSILPDDNVKLFFYIINRTNGKYIRLSDSVTNGKMISPDMVVFEKNKKYGLMNFEGKLIADAEYDTISNLFYRESSNEIQYLIRKNDYWDGFFGSYYGGKNFEAESTKRKHEISNGPAAEVFILAKNGKKAVCSSDGKFILDTNNINIEPVTWNDNYVIVETEPKQVRLLDRSFKDVTDTSIYNEEKTTYFKKRFYIIDSGKPLFPEKKVVMPEIDPSQLDPNYCYFYLTVGTGRMNGIYDKRTGERVYPKVLEVKAKMGKDVFGNPIEEKVRLYRLGYGQYKVEFEGAVDIRSKEDNVYYTGTTTTTTVTKVTADLDFSPEKRFIVVGK